MQDCTGSQGSYITSATKNIQSICQHIFESGKLQAQEDLRIGLVAYRDHPPQDHTYVTKNFGFSSDISYVHKNLSSLYASGGGDGDGGGGTGAGSCGDSVGSGGEGTDARSGSEGDRDVTGADG